jgi:AcrR family transcriptional regulator
MPAPVRADPGATAPSRGKRAAVVAAAWRTFLSQGFAGASMDAIAHEASVSKATLYAHFRSKDELFEHVVAEEGARHSAALEGPPADAGVEAELRRAALDLSALMLSADNMAVMRMIVAESGSPSPLGARFFKAGPDVLIGRLATRIADAMRRGELRSAPPREAAGQFIGLILGELHLQALLGARRPPGRRAREAAALSGAAAFLRAYGPDGGRHNRKA